MFEHFLIVSSMVLLTICAAVLAAYFVEFIHFVKENKRVEERRIQKLDETVNKILQYKKVDTSRTIIDKDTKRYQDLNNPEYYKTDAYFEDLVGRELVYMDDVRMWHKVKNKTENETN